MRHRLLLLVVSCGAVATGLTAAVSDAAVAGGGARRAPAMRARPGISGAPVVRATLTAAPGRWSRARSFAYRWERCDAAGARCHTIARATARRYTLARSDAGHRIRVRVQARNAWGSAAVTSGATRLVRAAPKAPAPTTGGSTTSTPAGTAATAPVAPSGGTTVPTTAGTAAGTTTGTTNTGPTGGGTSTGTTPGLLAPTVTGVSPAAGPTAGQTTVTIQGSNLLQASAVKFGGVKGTITADSSSQITATSPAGSAGTVDVTVTTLTGTSPTGAGDHFTYYAPPAVSGVSPSSGPTTGGTSVTITGSNLAGATGVRFGSAAASVTSDSATQITATSPSGSAATVDVTVTTPGGTSAAGSGDHFTYTTSGGGTNYFDTVPSSENGTPPAGIPRSDSFCASVVQSAPENRPQNATANNTVPADPSAIDWGTALNYWTAFVDDRNQVTGDYKGTTDEILQWVSCKWGIDANIARADAVVESSWNQSTEGDTCSPNVAGEGSFGILQVRNKYCDGSWVHGGYPYTADDTALDADYWGARLRACFDGAFYNGGQWLYNGQTIGEVITAHGEDYAMWGCIGAWFDGNWYDSGAQQYMAKVQNDYNTQPWTQPGF